MSLHFQRTVCTERIEKKIGFKKVRGRTMAGRDTTWRFVKVIWKSFI